MPGSAPVRCAISHHSQLSLSGSQGQGELFLTHSLYSTVSVETSASRLEHHSLVLTAALMQIIKYNEYILCVCVCVG